MAFRCSEYLHVPEDREPDITICSERYKFDSWTDLSENDAIYMESGFQFNTRLLQFNGLMLHASAVELAGKAYLFSGPCGMGKSTHTKLWQQTFGSAAQVFNDDKPALRYVNCKWYAYGTPWCGKDGINQNKRVPLAGICFLKRGESNCIRQLNANESIQKLISQTRRKFYNVEWLDLMLKNVEQLVRDIPIFELQNRPEPDAVRVSYEAMHRKAEEMGL